jgi:hypothetical protein
VAFKIEGMLLKEHYDELGIQKEGQGSRHIMYYSKFAYSN